MAINFVGRYEQRYGKTELNDTMLDLIAEVEDLELDDEDKKWLRRFLVLRFGLVKQTARHLHVLDEEM